MEARALQEGWREWSAANPLMVDPYLDKLEGLLDLAMELEVAVAVFKYYYGELWEKRLKEWAIRYRGLEEKDLQDWLDRKMDNFSALVEMWTKKEGTREGTE